MMLRNLTCKIKGLYRGAQLYSSRVFSGGVQTKKMFQLVSLSTVLESVDKKWDDDIEKPTGTFFWSEHL